MADSWKTSNLRWFRKTNSHEKGRCPDCRRPQTLLGSLESNGMIGKDRFVICWRCQKIRQLDAEVIEERLDPQTEQELRDPDEADKDLARKIRRLKTWFLAIRR